MEQRTINVRVPDNLLREFDEWCARQEVTLTRSEAIRQAMTRVMAYSIRVRAEAGK